MSERVATVRPSGRQPDEIRAVRLIPGFLRHAEGSVLIETGKTRVICSASVEDKVPPFLKGSGLGWVTAEYGMLPRATNTRNDREAAKGKQSGRTQEIQRLIGRSLRSVVDRKKLGERSVLVDCDVVDADGGTRTASITGSYVALVLALRKLVDSGVLAESPLSGAVAAVSVGICNGVPVADLEYEEDSKAEVDMNFVMDDQGRFIEVQGTAEGHAFTRAELESMTNLADASIRRLLTLQQEALRG